MRKKDLQRRQCTHCRRKVYTRYMQQVYYPLLKMQAWHCEKCLSQISDNLQIIPGEKSKSLLELFSGSKTVSSIAENEFHYSAVSVDNDQKLLPSICTDISSVALHQFPERNKYFVIWASLPCTYYSILNVHAHWQKITYSHRQYYYIPATKEARAAVQLLEKTLWIIRRLNPVYWFIENPRGALRHMPQMNSAPFVHTVSYHDYAAEVYKPTDIFTNFPGLQLKQLQSSVGRSFPGSVTKMNNAFDRSIVPAELIRSILQQVEHRHF